MSGKGVNERSPLVGRSENDMSNGGKVKGFFKSGWNTACSGGKSVWKAGHTLWDKVVTEGARGRNSHDSISGPGSSPSNSSSSN